LFNIFYIAYEQNSSCIPIKNRRKKPACSQKRIHLIHVVILIAIYPPICTVGNPPTITPPWAVISPCLAAGLPPINTDVLPFTITSGGPAQTHMSETTDAGNPPISTFATEGPVTGPPTCGLGVAKGQVCISVILAAEGIFSNLFLRLNR
jgi:hypothetical protein